MNDPAGQMATEAPGAPGANGAATGAGPVDRSALMHNYAEPAVTFVRGQGSTLYDTTGKAYLDFLSGLAVTSLGHAHPAVAEAVADQARTLSHVSNLFGNLVGPEVAVTLDRLIGGGSERAGGQVFFGNSGAEANECAIKLARRWAGPGRFAVVSTWDAFHGRTLATLAATGQPAKQTAVPAHARRLRPRPVRRPGGHGPRPATPTGWRRCWWSRSWARPGWWCPPRTTWSASASCAPTGTCC